MSLEMNKVELRVIAYETIYKSSVMEEGTIMRNINNYVAKSNNNKKGEINSNIVNKLPLFYIMFAKNKVFHIFFL